MKIIRLIKILFIYLLIFFNAFADEINFEADDMKITKNGNLIIAYNSKTIFEKDKTEIKAKKAEYNKLDNKIIFTEDVKYFDYKNNINLNGDYIIYDIKKDIVYSKNDVFLDFNNKYKARSKNLIFDRANKKIFSDEETIINDNQNNEYFLKDNFKLFLDKEIITAQSSLIKDKFNNKYYFEDLMINLSNNHIAGREVKIEFFKSYFGNEKNDPKLKGKSAISDEEKLKIYKAVFSTCNTSINTCRGWELSSREFKHNKKNKIFEYFGSWLKIFDIKLFYLPYFNHPDPSVKRKSGFLTPSYSSSETLGTSINIPYFKVLSEDKDITFNPRIYADKSFLFQNEYRQSLSKSNIISDFSFLVGSEGTKSHFFYNQIGEINKNLNYEINLQDVKGDNYLKKHKLALTSPLIDDESLLLSNFDMNYNNGTSELKTSFKVFEDLSRNYHDRYQYIFPDFSFKKNIDIPSHYNGVFDFHSQGYHKNFETNIIEAVVINDFTFTSNDFVSNKGFIGNYSLLLKNTNNYSENSAAFDENKNYDLFTTLKYDLSLPLQKKLEKANHFLKPIASFRFSPNGNTDLSSKDISLNYDNVFGMNRINTNSQVEGGESLTLGLEFFRENNIDGRVFDFKVANVIKAKKEVNLPSKSKLDQTRSDIFGEMNYKVNKNINLGYFFSYDRDLKSSNLEGLDVGITVNNLITNFNYYTEDNDINSSENIKNESTFEINDQNKLGFIITKDLKEDFTQYYDLNYEYKTDCISINLKYNRTFYDVGNLEPNKSISFLVKIIPFTELGVANITSVFGN
tara:strand:+ start:2224 stop:4617 length:2394 start_codon:yes stop_codon:yes gene_type:complete